MSKLNAKIKELAKRLCSELSVAENEISYAGLPLDMALETGVLTADVIFQKQFAEHMFQKFSLSYFVIDISDGEFDELFDVLDESTATQEQLRSVENYFKAHHPRLSLADPSLEEFLLYASVRSALFNWKEPSKTRLSYGQMLIHIEEGIVLVDHISAAMNTLKSPNRLLHIEHELNNEPTVSNPEVPAYEPEQVV